MVRTLCVAVVAFVILGLSLDSHAVSCNRKAQTHISKAQNIFMMTKEFHNIPSKEDEEFVLCMMEEKEDKEDFQKRVRKLKDEKRASEDQQAQERAKAAAQKQRDQQIENRRAQEEAALEARANRRVITIQGTGGNDGYYLGRLTPDDVVIVEPLQGRYWRVGLVVDSGGYTDPPQLRFSLGEKIPSGQMGGTGVLYETTDSVRIKVRQAATSLAQGRLGNVQLQFGSYNNDIQIRVTILCVEGRGNPSCTSRFGEGMSTNSAPPAQISAKISAALLKSGAARTQVTENMVNSKVPPFNKGWKQFTSNDFVLDVEPSGRIVIRFFLDLKGGSITLTPTRMTNGWEVVWDCKSVGIDVSAVPPYCR